VRAASGGSTEWRYTALEDALASLAGALRVTPKRESVETRQAFGRVLAADVVAVKDWPARDVSHFDGYAVISTDTQGASPAKPITLVLVGGGARGEKKEERQRRGGGKATPPAGVRPGVIPRGTLRHGRAMTVLTGGYLPKGADAVVPLEDLQQQQQQQRHDSILVQKPVARGEHVYEAGADVGRGECILRVGRELRGQDLVLLASLHVGRITVFKRPRVAILPTGSELTSNISSGRTTRRGGTVVESNSLLLRQVVAGAGGEPVPLGIVRDDRDALALALKRALRENDIVFTLAGSSVGGPDLVDSTIRGFGRATTALVHGLKVNRGRVMGFAMVYGKPIVILPGPIQGALNAFIVLGYPLIRYHLGRGLEPPPSLALRVGADWEPTGRFKHFDQVVYLTLVQDPAGRQGELVAMPSGGETEKVSFLISKDAYTLLPGGGGGQARMTRGELVLVHLLPGFSSLRP
jgi:molybdopterin biosynthesis enzyme